MIVAYRKQDEPLLDRLLKKQDEVVSELCTNWNKYAQEELDIIRKRICEISYIKN